MPDQLLLSAQLQSVFNTLEAAKEDELPSKGTWMNDLVLWKAMAKTMEDGYGLPDLEKEVAALQKDNKTLKEQNAALEQQNNSLETEYEEFKSVYNELLEKCAELQKQGKSSNPKKPEEWPEEAIKILVELAKLDYPVEMPRDRKKQLVELVSATGGIPAASINWHLHTMHMEGLVFMAYDEGSPIVNRWEINDAGRGVLNKLKRFPEVDIANLPSEISKRKLMEMAQRSANIGNNPPPEFFAVPPPEKKEREWPVGAQKILVQIASRLDALHTVEAMAGLLKMKEGRIQHFLDEMKDAEMVYCWTADDGNVWWKATRQGLAYLVARNLI